MVCTSIDRHPGVAPLPKRTHILVAGLLAYLVMTAGAAPASADSNCSDKCKAAYGSCYKSSQERARCQSVLQRCLWACIKKKR